jgi:hypothetical protein
MNRYEYLALPDVSNFVSWLMAVISGSDKNLFNHSYLMESRGKPQTKKHWSCNSLYDAFLKYEWSFSYTDFLSGEIVKGKTFIQSEITLAGLRQNLRDAVQENNDDLCFEVCCMILKWGGVLGSETYGNKKSLLQLKPQLAQYLTTVRTFFAGDALLAKDYKVLVGGVSEPIRMNAGYTKIYSLLCDDFVIYDGRVGAALCLLVRLYLEFAGQHHRQIPDGLNFSFGHAKNPKVNRNPSTTKYQFHALRNQPAIHIRNNLMANWLIGDLSLQDKGPFSKHSDPYRAFEAALFMIGYKI